VIVIGAQGELARITRRDLLFKFGLDEVDRVVLPADEFGIRSAGPQKTTAVETIVQRVRAAPVEEIILALSWMGEAEIDVLLGGLRAVPLPVRLLPDRAVSQVLQRQNSALQRSFLVELQRAPLSVVECWLKRLLDVAVAYALRPKLLFLDEPTSGVSTRDKGQIMDTVSSVVRAGTVTAVVIEHDMDVVFRYSDRIVMMHEGRFLADGSPEEIKANSEVASILLGAPLPA